MATTVRAKFRVDQKAFGDQGSVVLNPVYSSDPSHENKAFWDATPGGRIELYINNKASFAKFKVGQEIPIDFHFPE